MNMMDRAFAGDPLAIILLVITLAFVVYFITSG